MAVLDYIAYSFATCLFIFVVPGPIFFLSITEGVRGIRQGMLMLLGVAAAQSMLVGVLATGLLLLLKQVIPELTLFGGVFLLWIGFSAIRTAVKGQFSTAQDLRSGSFARGFVLTFANPAFILWLLTVGATILETGLSTVGSPAYAIFWLDILATSAGISLILIFLSSRGHQLTGRRGMQILTLLSGIAFIVLGLIFLVGLFP